MAEKYEYYMKEAENCIGIDMPEHPELYQVFMTKGVGYVLLAIAHELRVIEQILSKETKKGG